MVIAHLYNTLPPVWQARGLRRKCILQITVLYRKPSNIPHIIYLEACVVTAALQNKQETRMGSDTTSITLLTKNEENHGVVCTHLRKAVNSLYTSQ